MTIDETKYFAKDKKTNQRQKAKPKHKKQRNFKQSFKHDLN